MATSSFDTVSGSNFKLSTSLSKHAKNVLYCTDSAIEQYVLGRGSGLPSLALPTLAGKGGSGQLRILILLGNALFAVRARIAGHAIFAVIRDVFAIIAFRWNNSSLVLLGMLSSLRRRWHTRWHTRCSPWKSGFPTRTKIAIRYLDSASR